MVYYLIVFLIITSLYLYVTYKKKNIFNLVFFPFLFNGIIMVFLYSLSLGISGKYFNIEYGDLLLFMYFLIFFIGLSIIELHVKPLKLPTFKTTNVDRKIPIFIIVVVLLYFLKNYDLIVLAITNPRMFYASTRIGGGLIFFVVIPFSLFVYYIYISKLNYLYKKSFVKLIIATIVIFAFLYVFGQKSTLLTVGLLLVTTYYFKSTSVKKNLTIIKIGIVFMIMFLGVFALYTVQQNMEFNNIILNITSYSDYLSNFNKLCNNLDNFTFGKTFLEDEFLGYIPRFIWPNKPTLYGSLKLGLEVPELVDWTLALTGAPSFAPLGAVYADFGIFGIFLKLLISFVFAFVAKGYELRIQRKYNFYDHFMFLTFCGVIIFSIPLTTFPLYQCGIIVVVYLISKLSIKKHQNSAYLKE